MGYWGVFENRLQHGPFRSINDSSVIPKTGTWTQINLLAGSGLLLFAYFWTPASAESERTVCRIQLDGVILHPYEPYEDLDDDLGLSDSSLPLQLLQRNDDGLNSSCYYFPNGLRFNTSLLLEAQISAGAAAASFVFCHAGYEEGLI